jgi:L-fucose isomerase-like protein
MNQPPRIGFVPCIHPIYHLPSVVEHADKAISALRDAGCNVITAGTARLPEDVPEIIGRLRKEEIDLLVFFFCTWVAEEIPLSIAREFESTPLLLWALPCLDPDILMPSPVTGITATGCNLLRIGKPFLHRIGAVTPEHVHAVTRTARIAASVLKLRRARFAIFGDPCPGMIDTVCDDASLTRLLGPTTTRSTLETLLQSRDKSSRKEALRLARRLKMRVGRIEPDLDTVADQYRFYLGLKSLIRDYSLDGFSVRCWPELRDRHKATVCLAMSELAEEGIPSACEADLTSLITSYILTSLSGQPSCTLEITACFEAQDALQLAHCGMAALSLCGNPGRASVRGHMRTGAGALIEFDLPPRFLTIAKLLRPDGDRVRLFLGRGETIPTDPPARGTVATVRVEPSASRFLECMLHHGVEHHLVVVYGDWTEDLAQFARFAGIECIAPSLC